MTIIHIFKSVLGSSQYVFGGDPEKKADPIKGKVAHFMQTIGKAGSEFRTSIEAEANELMNEIHLGHPHIYQDADVTKRTVDSDADPLAALRAQIAIEERAKLVAQGFTAPKIEDSTSVQSTRLTGMANSQTLVSNSQDNAPNISKELSEQKNTDVSQTSSSDAMAALKAKVAKMTKPQNITSNTAEQTSVDSTKTGE